MSDAAVLHVIQEGETTPTPVPHTTGRPQMIMSSLLAGENQTDDRLYGGARPASYTVLTGGGVIKAGAGLYYGYKVTGNLGAGAITIRDNASADTGNVLDVIAASTSAPANGILATPIPCSAGIKATFASTGTVLFLYT